MATPVKKSVGWLLALFPFLGLVWFNVGLVPVAALWAVLIWALHRPRLAAHRQEDEGQHFVRLALFYAVFAMGAILAWLSAADGSHPDADPRVVYFTLPFTSHENLVWLPLASSGLMLMYVGAVRYLCPRVWHTDGRFANSIYYLGFLFTLASLVATLWAFGAVGSPNSVAIRL